MSTLMRLLATVVMAVGLTLGGRPAAADATPARSALVLGANLHPLQEGYASVPPARALDLAGQVGATVVRIDIHWGWFEFPGPSETTWYRQQVVELDRFLDAAASRHIAVLATVSDSPCWAVLPAGARCNDPGGFNGDQPPRDPALFAGFLRRLVRHAAGRIAYYEIWNEPDTVHFWGHPSPEAYAHLLAAAYPAIKAADPHAVVLAGATSGADVRFLAALYADGAARYFDALSMHPYSGNRPATSCAFPRYSFRCGVRAVHALMLRERDHRPLWLTEMGISTGPDVSAGVQAGYVRSAFALARTWAYVRGALWYELFDDPSGHDRQRYGLFNANLGARPAAKAFRLARNGRA